MVFICKKTFFTYMYVQVARQEKTVLVFILFFLKIFKSYKGFCYHKNRMTIIYNTYSCNLPSEVKFNNLNNDD